MKGGHSGVIQECCAMNVKVPLILVAYFGLTLFPNL